MRRILLTAVAAVSIAFGVMVTVLLAQTWTDTQTSSGAVNVTTESADLYICEPTGGTGDPDCPGDDSAADETIFETIENLYPGATATWDIRLRNVGTLFAWDVTGFTVTPVETQDPGDDCNDVPTVWASALAFNDNHVVEQYYSTSPSTPRTNPPFGTDEQWLYYYTGGSTWFYKLVNVHVAAGGYDDMRVWVQMPSTLAAECKDNVWDINIDWTVTPH